MLRGKLITIGAETVLLRSVSWNATAEGCVPHEGDDALWSLPQAGWSYIRVGALSVHQTEAAKRALHGMQGAAETEVSKRDAAIAVLTRRGEEQEEAVRTLQGINASLQDRLQLMDTGFSREPRK